jgi:DNA-binding CsgD family transcriptional regulator
LTNPLKQVKNNDAGNPTWTELLALCISSLGTGDFPQSLIRAIKTIAEFDNSVIFAYYKKEKPLCLHHTFSPAQRIVFVDDYLKGPYLLDPFFTACSRRISSGLHRLRDIAPDRFYQSEYYRSYYARTGLSEEICYIFYQPDGVAVLISLMRSDSSSKFSARQFKLLQKTAPIVISLAQHHWQNIPDSLYGETEAGDTHHDHSLIANTVGILFGQRITPRETQVVVKVLEGHSSGSIAESLNISVGTVRIHRRNIYSKLQISSQQELFAIFFKEITADQD